MEILILASGSKGNAISIKTKTNKILVDIGISFLSINRKLNEESLDINNYDTLLITHEHSDHIRGLKTLLKKNIIKNIYISKGTFNAISLEIRGLFPQNTIIVQTDVPFSLGDTLITPFMLSHDAAEPISYVVEQGNKKVVILTDTGYVDRTYYDLLSNGDLYIVEANHDPELLMKSRRPYHLKSRIVSEKGHLSNYEASWLVNKFIENKSSSIWAVAHISEDCNTVYNIEESIVKLFDDPTKIEIIYTSQETSEKIKLW